MLSGPIVMIIYIRLAIKASWLKKYKIPENPELYISKGAIRGIFY